MNMLQIAESGGQIPYTVIVFAVDMVIVIIFDVAVVMTIIFPFTVQFHTDLKKSIVVPLFK